MVNWIGFPLKILELHVNLQGKESFIRSTQHRSLTAIKMFIATLKKNCQFKILDVP